MPIEVHAAESTELFTGPPDEPLQIVRVFHQGGTAPAAVRVEGPGLQTVGEFTAHPDGAPVEVAVRVTDPVVGARRSARAVADGSALEFDFVVAPGASYRPIELAFDGSTQLSIDRAGNLVVGTGAGTLVQHAPKAGITQSIGQLADALTGKKPDEEAAAGDGKSRRWLSLWPSR